MEKIAVLSAPILIEEGRYVMERISLFLATRLIGVFGCSVYTSHETVRILGLDPDTSRRECQGYERALVIKPKERLEFGREYSAQEIKGMGFDIFLIEKR